MSKKGENIRKRKDGRWEGRYIKGHKSDGSIIYGSVYGKSYKEVRNKKQNAIFELRTQKGMEISNITISELLAIWKSTNSVRLKGATKIKYDNLIQTHIVPELGDFKLSDISIFQINRFLNHKLENGRVDGKGGLSASYVKSIAVVLSSALEYAVSENLCNPFKSKICMPILVKEELTILPIEQQRLLETYLMTTTDPTNIGIILSLYTGLRIGEICALAWDDINFNTNTIYVRHTVSRVKNKCDTTRKTILILDEPKTPAAKRTIPIPTMILQLLKEYSSKKVSEYVISKKNLLSVQGLMKPDTTEY